MKDELVRRSGIEGDRPAGGGDFGCYIPDCHKAAVWFFDSSGMGFVCSRGYCHRHKTQGEKELKQIRRNLIVSWRSSREKKPETSDGGETK